MKREIKLVGLSYSQSQVGSYVAVLSEVNGFRKIPIIIKTNDAQIIALKIEKMELPRPTSHDVIKKISSGFNLDCREVQIYDVVEGVFYCKLIFSDGIDEIEIDSSCGDAIITSMNFECPLYASEDVLSSYGIASDDDGNITDDPNHKEEPRVVSIGDLEKMMEDAINEENYELAAELRDKISKINSSK